MNLQKEFRIFVLFKYVELTRSPASSNETIPDITAPMVTSVFGNE